MMLLPVLMTFVCIAQDRNLIPTDTIGFFRKWAETNPDVASVDTVAGPLLNIIDESTREKEGGQFVHIDGSRLPW